MVDNTIVSILLIPLWIQMLSSWSKTQTVYVEWKWLILCFLLQFFYRWIFLAVFGGTLGKMIFGLRVVNKKDGQPVTYLQSLIRVICDHFSFFFAEAFKALLFLRIDRTHLSDWIAETQVRQATPRTHKPERRVLLTLVLFFYFFTAGFLSIYHRFNRAEFDPSGVTIRFIKNDQ